MQDDYKFGILNPDDQPYCYLNVWATEETSGGSRLVIAPGNDQVGVLLRLMEVMPEPFGLLYVLVVPRGEGEPGHYQSPEPQTRHAVARFLGEFKTFLENDGRHHLWIASTSSPAMLVYDRHNLIYSYGPLEEFRTILSEIGLKATSSIQIPDPHAHHYHQRFDEDGNRMLAYWDWHYTPLHEADSK
jgi:hypothetical protein